MSGDPLIIIACFAVPLLVVVFIVPALRGGFVDSLNKELSLLINNSTTKPNRQGKNYISGTYQGYPITFKWEGCSMNVNTPWGFAPPRLELQVKIMDLKIPALGLNTQTDSSDEKIDTASLWHELSKLPCAKDFKFTSDALQIDMQWVQCAYEEGWLLRSPADYPPLNPTKVAQETSEVLEKVLKILQLSS